MKEETRTPKQIIVLGTNGTGKTTFVKKLVISELKKKENHILIVVPDDMEWNTIESVHPKFPERIEKYIGARKIIYYPGLIEIIRERFKNGLLVFDDCRAYFDASLDKDLHSLLIRRRQQMIDIVAVGHGFTEVPPKMFTFSTHIALFRTIDNIARRKDCINNFDEIKAAQTRINTKAITEPHYFEIIKTV
jgi:ABC-type Mn2+/Zn2+ transport system ATPase subunit